MALSPDEILRKQIELLVNVGGQPAVDELKRSLDLAQNSLNMFTQSAAAGNVSTADYLRNLNQMTTQVAAFSRAHSMATQRMTVDTAALTRSIYFAAQGVEDLQYGFNAFVNNIPLITTSFAQAMGRSQTAALGWGAALSVVGVTINSILIPAIQRIIDRDPGLKAFFDSMKNSLNPFHVERYVDAITKMSDRIKELEGKKIRLAVDTFELDETKRKLEEAKKAKEAFDDAMTGRSKAEREAGKAVEEALAEAPAGEPAVAGRVRAFFMKQGLEQSPLLKEKQAEITKAQAALALWEDPTKTFGLPPELIRFGMARAEEQIKRLGQEAVDIQTNIEKNAGIQAGEIIGKAKEGRAPDVAKILPFLKGFEKAPDLGIGPVAGDLSQQVAAAADAAREQVAIDRDIPALKKVADENEKVRKAGEALREGAKVKAVQKRDKDIADAATAYGTKLKDQIERAVAEGIVGGKADEAIEQAVGEIAKKSLEEGKVKADLIGDAAKQVVEAGVRRARVDIAARPGGVEEGARAAIAELDRKAALATHRAEQLTPQERERQREVERQARALEGHKGGLAEQLTPAILARMARGQQTEQIIVGLAPQVAGRVGRIPTVPAGMAPDISRQIVQDVLAKQGAPMAGEMAFAPNAQLAAMGLQAGNAAKAMERAQQQGKRADAAQRGMQERDFAQAFAAQGATNQQALTMAHRTVNLMQHGLGMQAAMLTAWNEMNHRLGQLEAQQQRLMQQQMRTRRRANLLNRGGPAG
jgi:hypothetical protein